MKNLIRFFVQCMDSDLLFNSKSCLLNVTFELCFCYKDKKSLQKLDKLRGGYNYIVIFIFFMKNIMAEGFFESAFSDAGRKLD